MSRIVTERFDYWPVPFYNHLAGSVVEDTTRQRSGVACAKCASGGVNTSLISFPVILNRTTSWRWAFRIPAFPGGTAPLVRIADATGTIWELSITAAGLLELWDPVTASHPPGTVTVGADAYFVVELQLKVPTEGNGQMTWKVNGVQLGEAAVGVRNTGIKQVTFGNLASATCEVLVDDFALNDDQGTIDNTWLGVNYPTVRLLQPVGCYQGALVDGDVYTPQRANIVPNPNFEVNTTKWAGGLGNFRTNTGAALTRDTTQHQDGTASAKLVTVGTKSSEGLDHESTIAVVSGTTYRVSAYVKGNAGGEEIQLVVGDGTVGSATKGVTLTTAFQRVDVTFTALASGSTGVAVRTNGTHVYTYWVDCVLWEASAGLETYFPTTAQLTAHTAFWTGTPNLSESRFFTTTRLVDAPYRTATTESFEADQGRKVGILHYSDPAASGFNGMEWEPVAAQNCYSRGAIPFKTVGGSEGICGKVLAGEFDTVIKKWAEEAAAFKHPFFLRLWWEMNGNWWKWSTTAAQYVEAWKYFYNKVKPIAPNTTFVWCPNVQVAELSTVVDFGAYYPGSEYVDWTGLDGYSGENPLQNIGWKSPANLYKPSYDRLREVAPDKPIVVCEISTSEIGGSKPTWITELLSTAIPQLMPGIRALIWYDNNIEAGENGRLDWPITSSAASAAAYASKTTGIGQSYYLEPSAQTLADLAPVPNLSEAIIGEPPPVPQINVFAIAEGGKGMGYNLSDDITGLQFSNVSPGGDESCTFTLHRPWHARNPEVDKGNLLRIMDGLNVLWQGRIEEADRQVGDEETIDVTAYGLGARLKDTTFKEIFIDRELSRWGAIPNPRIKALGANWKTGQGSFDVRQGANEILEAPKLALLTTRINQPGATRQLVEAWYDANGIEIGNLYWRWATFDQTAGGYVALVAPWDSHPVFYTSNAGAGQEAGGNFAGTASGTGNFIPVAGKVYVAVLLSYAGEISGTDGEWRVEFGPLIVFGRHGLTVQGNPLEKGGFKVSQLVGNIAARAPGITVRRVVDTPDYIVQQSAFLTPTVIEDGINEVNQHENDLMTWGTWGPDSPLDNSTNGYFDYSMVASEPAWMILREDCDSLDLHTETATLYNRVQVTYSPPDGSSKVVIRTSFVEDLAKMGVTRTFVLDAGQSTEEDAQNLGDAFLALTGDFAPARGSLTLTKPVRHLGGKLKPHFMRADGSAIKLPDILPFQTLFTLNATPDRRTIFPVKRVSVDCSERSNPKVSVDVDQTNDALSTLQSRLGLFSSLLSS